MADGPKKKSNIVVWVILGLLIFALGGFGIGNFGGSVRSIGAVGDTEIETTEYGLALQAALRTRQATGNGAVSLATPEGEALAAQVRRQLIGAAAVTGETRRLGLSVGDEAVRSQIVSTPAFQGIDGAFDREAYSFALQQAGLSEAQYESRIRSEAAADLTVAAVLAGVEAHPARVDIIAAYAGERRDILWLRLGPDLLTDPLPQPDDAALQAQYEANPEAYTEPEKKRLTYVWLTPEMAVEDVGVDEAELRALYDERADEYNRPERRLVERLIFPDESAALAAKAAVEEAGATFESLVQGRGLSLPDVDLGDVARDELGAAGDAVFAIDEPGLVGPVATDLGPALFRVNAILPAEETPFEDVREALRDEVALDRARRSIGDLREDIDDLLAGGATLEEVAAETDMELGTIEYGPDTADGIAGYAAFRDAAEAVSMDDFPELLELEDGGLFALQLDAVMPPALLPLEEVRDRVAADWRGAETERRLMALADEISAARADGQSLEEQGYAPERREALARDAFLDGAPAGLIDAVFDLEDAGETAALAGSGEVHLVELLAVRPESPEDPGAQDLRQAITASVERSLSQDALDLFVSALEAEAGITLNQAAINAVHAQFP